MQKKEKTMYKILRRERLNENVVRMDVLAPMVAKKCKAGQFIMLRINETGERIPLTVADYDREEGSVTIIFQEVGKTTKMLGTLGVGEYILDFAGPLGKPSEFDGIKKAVVIGGGLGCAIAYPQAKALKELGAHVDLIAGFRNKELVILEEEMKKASDNLYICTDDGSYGEKGFVTNKLTSLLEAGNEYDIAIAIGPLPMMKFVCKATEPFALKTIVSLNPIMIDGTGMCGGCRVRVGGQTKFACVDGPDFDGHLVDFDDAIRRSAMYKNEERQADEHYCNLQRMCDENG